MFEQIQKLQETKTKLKTDFEEHKTEYRTETKRIDRAIKIFEKGINELKGSTTISTRQKRYSVIEEILAENGPLHLKKLCEKLHERGIPMHYQSLSGLMQMYVKAGKIFTKVAPATFGLIAKAPGEEEKAVSEKEGRKKKK